MELTFRQRTERPNKHGHCPIQLDLLWSGRRLRLPVPGVSILPAHWQPAKAKKIHSAAADSAALNRKLTRFQTTVEQVFADAEHARLTEAAVTEAAVTAALEAAGLRKPAKNPAPSTAPTDGLPPLTLANTWQEYYDRWQAENKHLLAKATLRKYKQVVAALARFDATLTMATLTSARLADYVVWLHAEAKRDSTVQQHYKFFRECYRLADKAIPRWLTVPTARFGRPLALKRAELRALAGLDLQLFPAQAVERDRFLLQTLLLLRDVDLRGLRRHHVSDHHLPGYGDWPCVALYQEKTGEPVWLPLPPPARAIWERYDGPPPLAAQTERNMALKKLGRHAGLTREWVKHSFSGKVHHEQLLTVWEGLTTHTARHTGAAMVLLGSEGDQTLKEIALGHITDSAYGYGTVERYGPLLLAAWAEVL